MRGLAAGQSVPGSRIGLVVERLFDFYLDINKSVSELLRFLLSFKELKIDDPLDLIAFRILFQTEDDAPQTVLSVQGELYFDRNDLRFGHCVRLLKCCRAHARQ